MGLQPKIVKEQKFVLKQCACCGGTFGPEGFAPSRSFLFPDGALPLCDSCIDNLLKEQDYSWDIVDKVCQYADIPFIPKEWERIHDLASTNPFHKYAEVFQDNQYDGVSWEDYFVKFKDMKDKGVIEEDLPVLDAAKKKKLRDRWGVYDDEGYKYLENLYRGLLTTQNINGKLQDDQALKICKISYEIDKRIEEGTDFDKLLSSYDKLVKAADFTPQNVKNINDFDTVGELVRWMEKRHWKNKFYDDVKRDVVDETIANIQNFNRRLYTNETGIGDDISHRIEMLKAAKNLENDNYYGTDLNVDLDNYDNIGYEQLVKDDADFMVNLDGETNAE